MIVTEPRVGDVGLVAIEGLTGAAIYEGQRLNGTPKEAAHFEHSFMLVGNDWVFEAQPGGAVISRLSTRYKGRKIVWVRPMELTDRQQADLGNEASKMLGTKYSFLDYVALFGYRYSLFFKKWAKNRVQDTGHMICSQIIDECYKRALGVSLFPNKWSGYVTPADYYVTFGGE